MSNSRWKTNAYGTTVRRKRNRHSARFVQLFFWMLATPAWRSLSPWAVVAYIELAHCYNGVNNGELYLSARELAKRCGGSRATAARAIAELVAKGFVEITRNSGFNVKGRPRQATEYRLTVLFCDLTKKPASNAFKRWRPNVSPATQAAEPSEQQQRLTSEAVK
jgi:DNA-binding transcriptional regulator YhcF (GntR family)